MKSWGYGGKQSGIAKLETLMNEHPHLIIVDCRLIPHSSYYHEFDAQPMKNRFGDRYIVAGKYLGNAAMRRPGATPDRGIWKYPIADFLIIEFLKRMHQWMSKHDYEPLFLCAGGAAFSKTGKTRCHRVDVAALAREVAWVGAEIEHLR